MHDVEYVGSIVRVIRQVHENDGRYRFAAVVTRRESRLSVGAVFSVRGSLHDQSLLRSYHGKGAEHCETDSSVYGREGRKEVVICLLEWYLLF